MVDQSLRFEKCWNLFWTSLCVLLPPIAFVISSSKYYKKRIPILNWIELVQVESLYTCQCKTISFASKKYYKLKSEKDCVLYYYAVPILPKNVLVKGTETSMSSRITNSNKSLAWKLLVEINTLYTSHLFLRINQSNKNYWKTKPNKETN